MQGSGAVLDTYSTVWMVREAVALVPLDRHTEGKKGNILEFILPAKRKNLATLLLLAATEFN